MSSPEEPHSPRLLASALGSVQVLLTPHMPHPAASRIEATQTHAMLGGRHTLRDLAYD